MVGLADEITGTKRAFNDGEAGSGCGGESVDDDILNPGGVFTRTATIKEPLAGAVPRAVGVRGRVVWEGLFHWGYR